MYKLKVRKYSCHEPGTENKTPKIQTIAELRRNIILSLPEQELWFAVLKRAILDIGAIHASYLYNTWSGIKHLNIKKHCNNSDKFFQDGTTFEYVCDCIGTYKSYVLRILKKYEVWPLSNGYYDESRYKKC